MEDSRKQRFYLFLIIGCLGLLGLSALMAQSIPLRVLNMADFPDTLPVKTDPFWSYHDQPIQIRGFWYPLSFDRGILASAPDLKSCCLVSSKAMSQRLIVKGQLSSLPAQQAITLKGIFRIDPLYSPEGQLIQLYVLEGAQQVPQTLSSGFLPIFLMGCLGIALVFYCSYSKFDFRKDRP